MRLSCKKAPLEGRASEANWTHRFAPKSQRTNDERDSQGSHFAGYLNDCFNKKRQKCLK
jgi:hypothetical protein